MTNGTEDQLLSRYVRLKLWLCNHFWPGHRCIFVHEGQVQVIYRDGHYFEARGPDIIHYSWLHEELGPLVHTGSQVAAYEFKNLLSRDGLPVNISLRTLVAYDPRGTLRDIARVLTKLPRGFYVNIAEAYYRWVLMEAVNKYQATEVARNEVTKQIEEFLLKKVPEEMEFLGVQPRGRPQILGVELPPPLTERQMNIAQRRANIMAGGEFSTAEFRRALVTEVIEGLDRQGGGETYINFNELLDSYESKQAETQRRIVENPPQPIIGRPPDTSDKGASQTPETTDEEDSRL